MNADLCAAKVYYETCKAHRVKAELVLLPGKFASTYCALRPYGRCSRTIALCHPLRLLTTMMMVMMMMMMMADGQSLALIATRCAPSS